MALFPSAVSPDLAVQKAAAKRAVKAQIVSSAQGMLESLDSRLRATMGQVWANPDLTPAEAVEALGTDAAVLFAGSAAIAQFLAAQYALAGVADYAPPRAPADVTIAANPDGTVTLS